MINRVRPAAPRSLERYCRGLDGWPRSWMALEKDLPPGEELVACFRPFLEELVASDLSPKTIQRHVDDLWALGGAIIRDRMNTLPYAGKAWSKFSTAESTKRVARSSARWSRRRTSSVPSAPLAASCIGSELNLPADPAQFTHKFPRRRENKMLKYSSLRSSM